MDVQAVLNAVAKTAARLCDAPCGAAYFSGIGKAVVATIMFLVRALLFTYDAIRQGAVGKPFSAVPVMKVRVERATIDRTGLEFLKKLLVAQHEVGCKRNLTPIGCLDLTHP